VKGLASGEALMVHLHMIEGRRQEKVREKQEGPTYPFIRSCFCNLSTDVVMKVP
jgi:hypothetical protein